MESSAMIAMGFILVVLLPACSFLFLRNTKARKPKRSSRVKESQSNQIHAHNPMTESGKVRIEPVLRAIREKENAAREGAAKKELEQIEISQNGSVPPQPK